MPLDSPLHELVLVIAIPFLDFADELLVAPFNLLQVIIGKLAPLLFEVTFELHPFPFELIGVHACLHLLNRVAPPFACIRPCSSQCSPSRSSMGRKRAAVCSQ